MKEQFVSYEIALSMKEMGFDEECFGYYTPMKEWMISTNPKYNPKSHYVGPNWCTDDMKMRFMYVVNSFGDRNSTTKNSQFTKAIKNIAVPLWQQAEQWLREKYGIVIVFDITTTAWRSYNPIKENFKFNVIQVEGTLTHDAFRYTNDGQHVFNTYQEAREFAIKKAIEVCKKKK